MKKMDKKFVFDLVRGASILACGGGLAYAEQLTELRRAGVLDSRKGVGLIDPRDLSDNDVYVTVAEIGPADAPPVDKEMLAELVRLYEKKTKKTVSGIIPGEIGQEAIALEAALKCSLPVVDADLAGCRAVPRLDQLAMVRQGMKFTMSPLMVLTASGEVMFVAKQASLAEDEKRLRTLLNNRPGEVVVFVGGAVTGEQIKKQLAYSSYTIAANLGKTAKSISGLKKGLNNKALLGPVKVEVVEVKKEKKVGFVDKKIVLSDGKRRYEMEVENEFMKLRGKGVKIEFPSLICLVDPEDYIGLSSGDLKVGQEAILIAWEAFDF